MHGLVLLPKWFQVLSEAVRDLLDLCIANEKSTLNHFDPLGKAEWGELQGEALF